MVHVKRFSISNITAFNKAELELGDGINVLIGENSTGKTHILKLIYACLYISDGTSSYTAHYPESLTKLGNLFKGNSGSSLLRVARPAKASETTVIANVRLELSNEQLARISWNFINFLPNGLQKITPSNRQKNISSNGSFSVSLFLPSREVLSMFPGFVSAYLKRELSFDETYYDLCLALDASPLRTPHFENEAYLLEPLREVLAGDVKREGREFTVETVDTDALSAHLVAEGLRKVATLVYLVKNGSITKDTILLWDEPEANLNPKIIKHVVEFLVRLSKAGVQIVLATHDYLFAREISISAEANLTSGTRFFSLYREEGLDGVQIESGETLADLQHNPIVDGYMEHYDRENALFAG